MRHNKNEKSSTPTNNQIYTLPADQFSPSAGTSLVRRRINIEWLGCTLLLNYSDKFSNLLGVWGRHPKDNTKKSKKKRVGSKWWQQAIYCGALITSCFSRVP